MFDEVLTWTSYDKRTRKCLREGNEELFTRLLRGNVHEKVTRKCSRGYYEENISCILRGIYEEKLSCIIRGIYVEYLTTNLRGKLTRSLRGIFAWTLRGKHPFVLTTNLNTRYFTRNWRGNVRDDEWLTTKELYSPIPRNIPFTTF